MRNGEYGYCGLRKNVQGKIEGVFSTKGKLSWYPDPPFLIASTVMVPGYIDAQEVGQIARFIKTLNPEIPYSLLAFHSQYKMADLPPTSRRQAQQCLDAAMQSGLKRVKVGNMHLLW